jgi:hypothetical protein
MLGRTACIYRCSGVETVANNIQNKLVLEGTKYKMAVLCKGMMAGEYYCFCLQQPSSKYMSLSLLLQESLEELGESAVSRLKKRRSLISLHDSASDRECSPSLSQASPHPVRTPQLLASLGLELDTLSLGNR